MAYEIPSFYVGILPADIDMSALQFAGVDVAPAAHTQGAGVGGTAIVKPAAGGQILGILQNNPMVGEAAQVMEAGVSKAKAGGIFVAGDKLAVDVNGNFVLAVTGNLIVAIALETGAAGVISTVLLKNMGIHA